MNKLLLSIFGALAVVAVAFGVIQMNAVSDQNARLDALNKRQSEQDAALQKSRDELKEAMERAETDKANIARIMKERDEADKRAKELAKQTEENAGIANAPQQGGDPEMKKLQEGLRGVMQGFAKEMDNPDVRKAMRDGGAQQVSRAYEGLFKKLNLNEGDSKIVSDLLNERNFAAMDVGRKLLEGKAGDPAAVAEVRKEIEALKVETDGKIKGVIGDQGATELSNYERTVGDERMLDGLARSFERKQQTLEPAARDGLAAIMREERLKVPSNEIPDLGGGPGMAVLMGEAEAKAQQAQEEAYQARVLARAGAAGLSPDQQTTLQESFKQQNQRKTMGRAFGRAFLGGGK